MDITTIEKRIKKIIDTVLTTDRINDVEKCVGTICSNMHVMLHDLENFETLPNKKVDREFILAMFSVVLQEKIIELSFTEDISLKYLSDLRNKILLKLKKDFLPIIEKELESPKLEPSKSLKVNERDSKGKFITKNQVDYCPICHNYAVKHVVENIKEKTNDLGTFPSSYEGWNTCQSCNIFHTPKRKAKTAKDCRKKVMKDYKAKLKYIHDILYNLSKTELYYVSCNYNDFNPLLTNVNLNELEDSLAFKEKPQINKLDSKFIEVCKKRIDKLENLENVKSENKKVSLIKQLSKLFKFNKKENK